MVDSDHCCSRCAIILTKRSNSGSTSGGRIKSYHRRRTCSGGRIEETRKHRSHDLLQLTYYPRPSGPYVGSGWTGLFSRNNRKLRFFYSIASRGNTLEILVLVSVIARGKELPGIKIPCWSGDARRKNGNMEIGMYATPPVFSYVRTIT